MVSAIIAAIATLFTFFVLPETHTQRSQTLKPSWDMLGLGRVLRSLAHPKVGRLFLMTFLSGSTFTIFAFAFQPFISNAVGPAIGGVLVSIGYRVPFWVTGVLTMAIGVFALTLRGPQHSGI